MPRIRTIKPETPQSASMGRLRREVRLCFILIWTLADDAGRLRGSSRMLASLLYPYDDDAKDLIDGWLIDLVRERCIRRYEVDGDQYIEICNWLTHQKIDKPSKSKLPAPPDHSGNVASIREESSEDQGSRTGTKDQGREGKGPVGAQDSRVEQTAEAAAGGSRDLRPTGDTLRTRAPDVTPEPWQWTQDVLRPLYPTQVYTDTDWANAGKCVTGILCGGHATHVELERLTRDFAAQKAARGEVGTQYVENPAKHYSPGGKWRGPFALPAAPQKPAAAEPIRTWRPGDDEGDDRVRA